MDLPIEGRVIPPAFLGEGRQRKGGHDFQTAAAAAAVAAVAGGAVDLERHMFLCNRTGEAKQGPVVM